MSVKVLQMVLAAAIANAGVLTVTYPAGTTRGDFFTGPFAEVVVNQKVLTPDKFTITFNAASFDVTNKSGAAWPANASVYIGLDYVGKTALRGTPGNVSMNRAVRADTVRMNLGSPVVTDDDAITVSAALPAAQTAFINGVFAVNGVATMDVPRNVIITSSVSDVGKNFFVSGFDEYGTPMKETIPGAAAIANGKKAFARVTGVNISADSAGLVKIGCGEVLGLPVLLPASGYVIKELQDGVVAAAGTIVLGDASTPSGTTGDVRGTYDPSVACDGIKAFALIASLPDLDAIGVPQYNG